MKQETRHPRAWLEAEYLRRRQKNPAYSLRAFAKLLDLPSGRVSQLLSEKRRFTPKVGQKIAQQLHFNPDETRTWLRAIALTRGQSAPELAPKEGAKFQSLDMDQFRTIAEPLHFSILSLLETEGCDGSVAHLARRLGVSVVEIRRALRRLERVGLVLLDQEFRARLAKSPGLTTSHDVSSAALREAHRQVLDETKRALEDAPVVLRDVTSITLAIDPARLAEAKEKIRAFRRSLSEFLEDGRRSEVYRLNVQLVPVTKKGT